MSARRESPLSRWIDLATGVALGERRAVILAFACNFVVMGSYYILRPVRDTVATVYGVERLHHLFTATFVGAVLASVLYAALASRIKLTRLLPGTFGFWLLNILLFEMLFRLWPESRGIAAAYYIWFSVVNLFMVSMFWSLMVDVFTPSQATRLFALIAAGGACGAIVGPILTRLFVVSVGLSGMLLMAAVGFVLAIALVSLLIHEKARLHERHSEAQPSTLDHALPGSLLEGFREIFKSPYVRNQAFFILLMTWVNTVAYFCQTDIVARSISTLEGRAQAIADIDLVVNICTAVILLFGVGRIVQRFGVTLGLVLSPLIMVGAFGALAFSPSLFMIQALQVVRRVAQYAIARPSREICFTVLEQSGRYKAKNVIDTVVYRFGDVSSAWVQALMRALGFGLSGAVALGIGASLVWGAAATHLGGRYEKLRRQSSTGHAQESS